MRISAIRGKNLASIEGEFEIDFTREPLASAGIFAITGPTGSGKSTILDALCLALFGKSPRQAAAREQGVELSDGESGKISQSDSRSILRKGTADGYAEADFTGLDGNLYRASWTVRRARNKPSGNLQDFNIELLNLSSGIPFGSKKTETLKEIERLIGLNYEQFTRSVMLAQGDFTAFLKAGRDEKAALLEKLTGTDIYTEISIAIYNKSKEAEIDCKLAGDQLKGISRLDQEEKIKLESREQELNLQLETTGKEYEQMRILLEWHARKENLEADIIRASEEQAVARKRIEENQNRIDQLSLTENVQPARTLLAGIDQLQSEITARQEQMMLKQETEKILEKTLEKLKQEETESISLLKIAEEQLEKAQPDLKTANALDVKIDTLAGQLIFSSKEAEEYGEAKRQSGERIAKTQEQLSEAEIITNDLTEWFNKNRTREPIVENLSMIVNSLESAASAMKNANALRCECVNLAEDAGKKRAEVSGWQRQITSETEIVAGLKAALQNILEEAGKYDLEKADQRLKEISVIHETLSNAENLWKSKSETLQALNRQYSVRENLNKSLSMASEALKPAVDKLQEARIRRDQTRLLLDHARLRTAENVEALRNTLEENKPCPVCGNTDHPYADHGKHLKEEQSLLETEYNLCCNQYDELMQNEARIRENLSHYALELDKANLDIPGIEKLYLDKTQKWKELMLPAKINSSPDDEVFSAIGEMKQDLKKESGELEKAVGRMNFLRKETERLRQDLEISVEKTGKLEKKVTESLHFIALLEKEIKHREERIEEYEKEYSVNTDRVDLWFAQPGWLENWKEDQDLFVTRIREFAAGWNHKYKKLEESVQQKEISEKPFHC